MPNIIIKFKPHFNTAFPEWNSPKGRWINTQKQYDNDMKKFDMVSYDQMKSRTESNKNNEKQYKPSAKALEIMKSARNSADKDGNVKLSGNTIKALHEMKALKPKIPNYHQIPRQYQPKGGFNG